MEYAVVDIETTGGNAWNSRVIEVSVFATDGTKILEEYTTLIDPGIPVPPFITQLTGIETEMLIGAPPFEEVADEIDRITKDRIFVAHNAGFDYTFLKSEFRSMGRNFLRKRLCTVRLSRKVFPGLSSYSLGKLCGSLEIEILDRHRAYGDARATTTLLKKLINSDENGVIEYSLNRMSREAILPPYLPREEYDELPEDPGVYYFHDKEGKVIYVGKAIDIRSRVTSHFSASDKRSKSLHFKNEIHHVSFELCGNELIALLHENHEIKRLWPKYNWSMKRNILPWGIYQYEDRLGYIRLAFSKSKMAFNHIATFPDFSSGWGFLQKISKDHELCPKLIGLHKTKGKCYDVDTGACNGACIGNEDPDLHNERLYSALDSIDDDTSTYFILGAGRTIEERTVVHIENGKYLGFGFLNEATQEEGHDALKSCIQPLPEDQDVLKIIQGYILRGKGLELIYC